MQVYLVKDEAQAHLLFDPDDQAFESQRRTAAHWTSSAISLDVEKALDSVWHDGLGYSLTSIGLPVKLVRQLPSFF